MKAMIRFTVSASLVSLFLCEGISVAATSDKGLPEQTTKLWEATKAGDVEKIRSLLAQGADVNAKGQGGNSPLHVAAIWGQKDAAELLIASGAEVNIRSERDQTPLCQAVFHGKKEMVELLVAHGADVNVKDKDRQTPLSSAQGTDREDIALLLINAGADIHAKGDRGATLLHEAAALGHYEVAKLLLDKGIDINVKDDLDRIPLHYAVGDGTPEESRLDMVKLLVARGAPVNAKDEMECTPLSFATIIPVQPADQTVQCEIVKCLIDSGADVDTRDNPFGGGTPLHWAAFVGRTDIIELLIAKGAKVNAGDRDGTMALHIVSRKANMDVARLLLGNGADANTRDERGDMPLHGAAFLGHEDMVALFVEHGADIAAKGMFGDRPVYEAVSQGHREIVEFLVTKGADIHALGKNGETLLHVAAEHGHAGMVEFLISKGLDVNAETKFGATPLELAAGWYRDQKTLPKAENSDGHSRRADYFYRLDQFDRAIEDYSSVIRENPKDDSAYYRRGIASAEEDSPQQAVADWRKAIELDWHNALEVYYACRLLKSPDAELDRLIEKTAIAHLEDLGMVSGYAVGFAGSPGDFYTVSLIISSAFDEKRFLPTVQSSNPVLRALAMICLARENKSKYKKVIQSFYTDTAEVGYAPGGCEIGRITLDKLAKSIIGDPDVLDRWSAAHTDWRFRPSERDKEREQMAQGRIGVIQTLIAHGANVNQKGRYGATLLHYAAENGDVRVAEFLIANGADVNAKNNGGEAPLHSATFWGYQQMIELLMKHGADIDARTSEGQTVLDIAIQQDYPGLATLLREYAEGKQPPQ